MILSTDNINSIQPAAIKQELTNIQHLNIHDDSTTILDHSPPPSSTPSTSSQDHINNNSTSKSSPQSSINSDLSSKVDKESNIIDRTPPPSSTPCNSQALTPTSNFHLSSSSNSYSSPSFSSVFPSISFPSSTSSFSSPSSSDIASSKIANMIMQQIQPEPENLHMAFDRDREESESYRDHSSGGVSPPPSPPPPHLSPSPTLPTMLGNSLGGGPPPLPTSSSHPPSPPISSQHQQSASTTSSSASSATSLASLHHALHGLHSLHSLQNLQNQMAALAGLQGGSGLGLVPPPPPSPAPPPPHGAVGGLMHPHLHQTGNSLGGGSPASNAAAAAAAAVAAAATSAAAAGGAGSSAVGASAGAMPQMVLTSGQVVQGVQGAQLLIPTSQGVAVQPILTITLGQAGTVGSSSPSSGLPSSLNPLHPLHPTHQQPPHPPPSQSHHSLHSGGSSASSPLPPSSSSTTSPSSSTAPHPLLGLAAGLPPSLFHPHHNNNNNNSTANNNNNNRSCTPEKPKMALSMPSPVTGHDDVQDLPYRRYAGQHDFHSVPGLGARLGSSHFPPHPPPPHQSRYSPDFLDTHNQPTISQAGSNMVDGVNLDEIKEFAKAFKLRRLSLGLTQTQVGQALSITEGPAYSQSAICRFEKLDITPKSALKIKPVLERWMEEAEQRYKNGGHTLTDFMGNEPTKKRKRRTSFTPQALEILNSHFERNTHPSGAEITAMAEQLGYEREVVRIWFCNKRQALKNTVRMMAKSNTPSQAPPPPLPPHSQIN